MARTLTLKKKLWMWEHSQGLGLSRTCNICHKRITKFEDMELDHVRAYTSGGSTLAMVHRDCNRMKSSGGLREIQKRLGIKDKPLDAARKVKLEQMLKHLKIKQLKELCDDLGVVRPKAHAVGDGLFGYDYYSPSKTSYIRRIVKSNINVGKIKTAITKYGR